MRRIAVINQKGGVGKTTTTANLGAALAAAGKSVLLVDLDPQGHLSLHFGVEAQRERPGIYDVLTSGVALAETIVSARPGLDVVGADIDLAAAESELVSVTGREVLLREALDALGGRYDTVLFDCPPSLGILTVNALAAATEVLIPLQAHFLALQGLSKLLSTVTLVRQRINAGLRVTGVVLCMHESTTRLSAEVVSDLGRFLAAAKGTNVPWADARVFSTPIRRNIKLAESSSFGQTVFDYAPKSNGALDYAALAAEVFGLTTEPERPHEDEEADAERNVPKPSVAASNVNKPRDADLRQPEPCVRTAEPAPSVPDEARETPATAAARKSRRKSVGVVAETVEAVVAKTG